MSTKRTSLYEQHVGLKAKMAPFAGWEMPLSYSSIKEEVIAVRNKIGIFDVGHMGEFFIEGVEAVKFVDHMITNDFADIGDFKAIYTPLCRENGTIVDDMICYKLGPEKVMICVNAANMEKDWSWFQTKVSDFNCVMTNKSDEFSLIAVQGPETEKILMELGVPVDSEIEYYSTKEGDYNGSPIIMARTGYTGEDGFELFCSHVTAVELWTRLLEKGATPCGLVSRDVLRLEVCYPLYGHELTDETTPLDSALKWTVKFTKDNFVGKETLSQTTPKYRLVKLSLAKGIPRDGYPIENGEGETIGKVTSGTMSVTIGKGIAVGLVEKEKFPKDKKLFIKVRNNSIEAEYHKKPFVTGGHK